MYVMTPILLFRFSEYVHKSGNQSEYTSQKKKHTLHLSPLFFLHYNTINLTDIVKFIKKVYKFF